MDEIELADAVRSLRAELEGAMAEASRERLQFEAMSIDMEFQVGITRSGEGSAGVKFWVVELGGKGAYAREAIQKVRFTLKPLLSNGLPVKIHDASDQDPRASSSK